MAHFVLRMFSYEPVADSLAGLGYDTAPVKVSSGSGGSPPPRSRPRSWTRSTAAGVDPTGLESDGWLYAQLYVSRPESAADLAAVLGNFDEEG